MEALEVSQSYFDMVLVMAAEDLARHDEAWCMRQFWIMADAYLPAAELTEIKSKELPAGQLLELYHAQLTQWIAWAMFGGSNVVIIPD